MTVTVGFHDSVPELEKSYALRSELNPTLGIILCADKDETVVRYSVLHDNEQLFASKYLRVLPSEVELASELERRNVLEGVVK